MNFQNFTQMKVCVKEEFGKCKKLYKRLWGWVQTNELACLEEEDETWSVNSRPLVSKGNSTTPTPERNTTISNRIMDAVWWHPCINPTDTIGHIIPPILPTELATPTPVVLTAVGYICLLHKLQIKKRRSVISNILRHGC